MTEAYNTLYTLHLFYRVFAKRFELGGQDFFYYSYAGEPTEVVGQFSYCQEQYRESLTQSHRSFYCLVLSRVTIEIEHSVQFIVPLD